MESHGVGHHTDQLVGGGVGGWGEVLAKVGCHGDEEHVTQKLEDLGVHVQLLTVQLTPRGKGLLSAVWFLMVCPNDGVPLPWAHLLRFLLMAVALDMILTWAKNLWVSAYTSQGLQH